MVLVDLVDFSKITNELGDRRSSEFRNRTFLIIKNAFSESSFKYIKDVGDLLVFFGNNVTQMLNAYIKLSDGPRITFSEISAQYRFIAHYGLFQFEYENDRIIDFSGSESNFIFRMEKCAKAFELITSYAFAPFIKQCLRDLPFANLLKADSINWDIPPKGFEDRFDNPLLKISLVKADEEILGQSHQNCENASDKMEKLIDQGYYDMAVIEATNMLTKEIAGIAIKKLGYAYFKKKPIRYYTLSELLNLMYRKKIVDTEKINSDTNFRRLISLRNCAAHARDDIKSEDAKWTLSEYNKILNILRKQ